MTGWGEHEDEKTAAGISGEGWAVVLYDDDVHEVKCVARALRRLAHLSMEQAIEATLKAERCGSAVVTITDEESARMLADELTAELMKVEVRLC